LIRVIATILIALACIGAQAAPISPGNYLTVPTELRDGMTMDKLLKLVQIEEAKQARRPQVIVKPFKVDAVPAVAAQSGSIKGQNALKEELIRGGAQIVDRTLTSSVQEELAFIEQTGNSRGVSFDLSDYLFVGEVLNANQTLKFTQGHSAWLSGGNTWVPSKCNINANATISLGFYTMNPFELKSSLVLEGLAQSSLEGLDQYSCGNYDSQETAVKAVQNAMNTGGRKIQDLFSPTGYIVEKRYHAKKGKPEKGKNMIFQTSLPFKAKENGNPKVMVYKTIESTDYRGRKRVEKALVGVGRIIDTVGTREVWIKMRKPKEAVGVMMGDIVEVRNQCGGAGFWNDALCWAGDAAPAN